MSRTSSGDGPRTPPPPPCLASLPPDELAKIIQFLEVEDIRNLQVASRGLHSALQDERIWRDLCDATWGCRTDVRQWLPAPGADLVRRAHARPPVSFRELFHLLRQVEQLCGLWRIIGDGPAGGLVAFDWAPDGIEGQEVLYRTFGQPPELHLYQRVTPRRGLTAAVEWAGADAKTVTLRCLGQGGAAESRLHRSSSGEAAAAVSFGGTPQSASILGASPEGSFEHAWLQFMSSNVQKSSKVRRRWSKEAAGLSPTLHHLRRVKVPAPSPRHPLAGLWLSDYGAAGLQVVALRYDFTGKAARIVAEKVTGDARVAAGQTTWWALAAALPVPWEQAEAALIETLEAQRDAEEAEEDEGPVAALADLFLAVENDDGLEMDGVPSTAAAAAAARRAAREVVGVHIGTGQVGGETEESAGRLWVHADGTLSFWWLEDVLRSVRMRRVDSELAAL